MHDRPGQAAFADRLRAQQAVLGVEQDREEDLLAAIPEEPLQVRRQVLHPAHRPAGRQLGVREPPTELEGRAQACALPGRPGHEAVERVGELPRLEPGEATQTAGPGE